MHPVVNHLIQLQELTLIKDEQKVTKGADHLQQLTESIKNMTQELPKDTRDLFEKLQKKNHNVIVPIAEDICSVCGMKIPISLIQAVRLGRDLHNCPNCARILFYPESAAKWVGRKPRRSDPRKVGISRFSSHTLMIPALESTDKEGVIGELAYKMEAEGFIDKGDRLLEAALRREAILCTAVDHGLAFPHARGVEGGGLTLALGISRKGIDFNGTGKGLSKIIFFLAIPTAASAFYLKLLSGLTETFMKADARKMLMAEKDPDKLWKALARVTRATIK
jgi:mannitol/fructose-specific phosphotransferase system IIA component (Ntr-type)